MHFEVLMDYHPCVEKTNPNIKTFVDLPKYKNANGIFGSSQAKRVKDLRSLVSELV